MTRPVVFRNPLLQILRLINSTQPPSSQNCLCLCLNFFIATFLIQSLQESLFQIMGLSRKQVSRNERDGIESMKSMAVPVPRNNKRKIVTDENAPYLSRKKVPKVAQDPSRDAARRIPLKAMPVPRNNKRKIVTDEDAQDPSRDAARRIILKALSKSAGEMGDAAVADRDLVSESQSVESALFQEIGSFGSSEDNKRKYRSIFFNLGDERNPELRRKVLLGEVKPERLATMTSEEMASNERQLEI